MRRQSRVGPYVDAFVINVSSPNTPNLRELQKDEDLARIIEAVKVHSGDKPVLVKIAPDLEDIQIKSIVDTARGLGVRVSWLRIRQHHGQMIHH